MKKSTVRTATIIATATAGAIAVALTSAAAKPGKRFDELDKDGDGRVAVSDFGDQALEFANRADADGDGFVTREELDAMRAARRSEMRKKRFPDDNNDGVVSKSEFEGAAAKRFEELDKNGDGVLSEDELPKKRKRGRG